MRCASPHPHPLIHLLCFAAGTCSFCNSWQLLLTTVGFQQVRNVYYANEMLCILCILYIMAMAYYGIMYNVYYGNEKHQHFPYPVKTSEHSLCNKSLRKNTVSPRNSEPCTLTARGSMAKHLITLLWEPAWIRILVPSLN